MRSESKGILRASSNDGRGSAFPTSSGFPFVCLSQFWLATRMPNRLPYGRYRYKLAGQGGLGEQLWVFALELGTTRIGWVQIAR